MAAESDNVQGIVLNFVNEQNRPLTTQNVADSLQNINLKKKAVQKALAKLARGQKISYIALQDQFDVPIGEDLSRVKKENIMLRKELQKLKKLAPRKAAAKGYKPRFLCVLQANQLLSRGERHFMALLNCLSALDNMKSYYLGKMKKLNELKLKGSLVSDDREENIKKSLSRYEKLINDLVRVLNGFGRVYAASQRHLEIIKRYIKAKHVHVACNVHGAELVKLKKDAGFIKISLVM